MAGGRPKQEVIRDVSIMLRVTKEENEKIEALAEKIGINKSRLIRNLVLGEIKETNMLYNLGAIPIAKAILKFTHSLKGEDFNEIIKAEN
jgi:predicted DNA-binding protein